jgi:hypothetical protein
MRLLFAIVLAAGCNQIYGVDDTTGSSCLSAPTFTGQPTLVVSGCSDYVTSTTDLAVAACSNVISESAVDAPSMTPSTFSPPANLLRPRLAHDGNELFAYDVISNAFVSYVRSSQIWTDPVPQIFDSVSPNDTISAPTATDMRHLMHANSQQQIVELAETEASVWSIVHTYAVADLSVSVASAPELSSDGLELVFVGKALGDTLTSVYFASRSQLNDTFALATRINGSEGRLDPLVSDDCSRLYFDDPTGVKYVER